MTNVKVSRGKNMRKQANVGDVLVSPNNDLAILTKDTNDYYRLVLINATDDDMGYRAGTWSTGYASIASIRDVIDMKKLKVVEDIEILIKE